MTADLVEYRAGEGPTTAGPGVFARERYHGPDSAGARAGIVMKEPSSHEPPGGRFDAAYYETTYRVRAMSRRDVQWWAIRYYARLAERLLRRTGGRRILDVGCGQGFLLGQLRPGSEAWGLEVSEYAAARCKETAPGARVLVGSIEDGPPAELPAGSFDVVIARYVLEHLRDPGQAIGACASLLRPGGYFLFSVPNTESPGLRIKGPGWFGYQDETHCSLLSPREWRDLVPAGGLGIEKVFSDGLWDVPYIKGVPKLLQYALFSLPTIAAVLFVSTALPLSWGENLIAIARKPMHPGGQSGNGP